MTTKIVTVLTIATLALGLIGTAATFYQSRVQAAIDRDRDREHIRVLEKIIVSEFPKWSPAIDWDDK